MKTALLVCGQSEFVFRQTPGRSGRWGAWQFYSGSDVSAHTSSYDAAVVYEQLTRPIKFKCDPARTLFVTGEPETIRTYDRRFLAQFSRVLSPRGDLDHPDVIRAQPAIPWWAGVHCEYPHKIRATLGYDEFMSPRGEREKSKLLSIVCSSKAVTTGHRKRLSLLSRLTAHFGEQLDVFGHGFREVPDKWDAIAPYRYHIVIENSALPHYWSEKLADAYLGFAFPLYWGCPNLGDYFPPRSFEWIERDDPAGTIARIERVLAEDAIKSRQADLLLARERLLEVHNLFPTVIRILEGIPASSSKSIVLRPECDFTDSTYRVARRWIKRRLGRGVA